MKSWYFVRGQPYPSQGRQCWLISGRPCPITRRFSLTFQSLSNLLLISGSPITHLRVYSKYGQLEDLISILNCTLNRLIYYWG
jgi:hypothetical protein